MSGGLGGILGLLLSLAVIGLIAYVLWWGLGKIAPPAPFDKIATFLIVIFVVAALISLFTGNLTFTALRW